MTTLTDSMNASRRQLEVHTFMSDSEETDGVEMVYVAIHDGHGNMIGNMNVSAAELRAALA